MSIIVPIHVARGELREAREILALVPTEPRAEVQERASIAVGRAVLARAEGRHEEALAEAEAACTSRGTVGPEHPAFKQGIAEALEAAYQLDDLDKMEQLLQRLRDFSPAQRSPFHEAQLARFGARLAARRDGGDAVETGFRRATAILREISARFWLAIVLLEHGEWLIDEDRRDEAEPLLAEARETFERLGTLPLLERLDALAGAPALSEP
jgi:hypothetical protein